MFLSLLVCLGLSSSKFGNVCPSHVIDRPGALYRTADDIGNFVPHCHALAFDQQGMGSDPVNPFSELDGISVGYGFGPGLE